MFARQRQRGLGIGLIQRLKPLQRRQLAIAITKALHAAAFLIHANQLRARGSLTDGLAQLTYLRLRGKIAGKQHHAGTGIVLQPIALTRRQLVPRNANLQHLVSLVEIARLPLVVAPLRIRARGQRQIVVALCVGCLCACPVGFGEGFIHAAQLDFGHH